MAESTPSAKATAQILGTSILKSSASANAEGWTTILSNTIRTSSKKDLFVDASLECGLYTDTTVKSKGGDKDTSTAEAIVQVRVMVDGLEAQPGAVTFCKRKQELEAKLQGFLETCVIEGSDKLELCATGEEEYVRLMLDTMSANSFNFIYTDLDSGDHTVVVQARIETTASEEQDAKATATIGKGSVSIESVRMVNGTMDL